tara:strand:- start:209 stop:454 length:246 start_codon:yes stop_codon:yes gene_type:complete
MVPMALIGPASSGFTTASIFQSAVSTSANYMVKRTTGKTIGQHAYETLNTGVLEQSYLPKNVERVITKKDLILPRSKPIIN